MQLEDLLRLHRAHGPELLDRVTTDPAVELANLGVRETGVCFRERNELALLPHREGVVGIERRSPPMPRLRIHEHRVHRVRSDLPLPPCTTAPSHAVRSIETFEHQSLGADLARSFVCTADLRPLRGAYDG